MKIKTEKFGELDYEEKDVVTFLDGLLGFEKLTKYIFIDKPESHPFIWVLSIEDPSVSFVSLNPYIYYPDYKISIQKTDHEQLEISSIEDIYVLTLVVVPADNPQGISTNLLAPIIVNRKQSLARQIILNNTGYTTKHYLVEDLKKREEKKEAAKRVA